MNKKSESKKKIDVQIIQSNLIKTKQNQTKQETNKCV